MWLVLRVDWCSGFKALIPLQGKNWRIFNPVFVSHISEMLIKEHTTQRNKKRIKLGREIWIRHKIILSTCQRLLFYFTKLTKVSRTLNKDSAS
jgi:hypothetical protein